MLWEQRAGDRQWLHRANCCCAEDINVLLAGEIRRMKFRGAAQYGLSRNGVVRIKICDRLRPACSVALSLYFTLTFSLLSYPSSLKMETAGSYKMLTCFCRAAVFCGSETGKGKPTEFVSNRREFSGSEARVRGFPPGHESALVCVRYFTNAFLLVLCLPGIRRHLCRPSCTQHS
jgi:hypothetical protein